MEWLQEGATITTATKSAQCKLYSMYISHVPKLIIYYYILFVCSYTSDCNSWIHNYYKEWIYILLTDILWRKCWVTVSLALAWRGRHDGHTPDMSVMYGEKQRTTITQHINDFIFYLYLIINEGFFFSRLNSGQENVLDANHTAC